MDAGLTIWRRLHRCVLMGEMEAVSYAWGMQGEFSECGQLFSGEGTLALLHRHKDHHGERGG